MAKILLKNFGTLHLKSGGVIGHSKVENDVVKLDRNMEYIDALNYKPIDSDTFHLTDAGKNLLYRLNRENLLIQDQAFSDCCQRNCQVLG